MTRKAWLGSLLLAATLATTACGNAVAPTAPKPAAPGISVAVAPVARGAIVQTFTFTGDVKPVSEVNVSSKQSGRVVRMPVEVGSRVESGDVIAELDHVTLDLNLEQARAELLTAQAKLASVKAGPLPENVKQAELNVDNAASRLQTLLNGPRPATVAQAQASVSMARAKLDAIQHPRPETVAQAQVSLDDARQRLAAIQAGGKPEVVAQSQASLDMAQAKLQALKNGARPEAIVPMRLAVDQAKNALNGAQISRDGACNPSNPHFQCDAANAQVNAAQSAVDQAVANLRASTAAPTTTDVAQAQAAVDQAQAALDAAKHPYMTQDVQQAKNAVAQAEAQLAIAQRPASSADVQQAQAAVRQAEEGLALASQPYTQEDVRQARNAVTQTEQQLALAKKPYTAEDIQQAEAGVATAQVVVDQALQAIKDTTVTAPVSGVVTQTSLSEGALASLATPLVTIASRGVKVQVPVEESQVAALRPGEDALISGSSLGSQSLAGKVTTLAPSGDSHNRTFNVDVLPTRGDALLPGMFVQVAIAVQAHQSALTVAKDSVVQRAGKPFVFAVHDSVASQVPVTIGLSTDSQVEIVEGIAAGDAVVIQGQQQLHDGDRVSVASAQSPAASAQTTDQQQ